MNEFVPPCWHGCAIEVSRSCQQGGTIVTTGWHKPEISVPLYEQFCKELSFALGKEIGTGEFGADMKVELVNDGPVTICMDTKNKE